jgi:hypothetical protein
MSKLRAAVTLSTLATLAFGLVACGGGGLKVTGIRSTHTRPSNVAAYFKVQTSGGDPVGGIKAEEFKIYEDGQPVSEHESKQVILNPEVSVSHYTMLLVDMSGSVSESGAIDNVVEAAAAFTERVEKSQKVGVYAFDGCEKLHPIAPFQNPGGATAAVRSLKGHKPDDPSTNLHGAIVKGLDELDTSLSRAEHPVRFGTLVVFSDGTDRAARVERKAMDESLDKATDERKYEVFAIALGSEMQESELKRIGNSGTAKAENKEEVVKAFEKIAQRIEATQKSYYLLSYCSPSRAGKHTVKIEATWKGEDGKSNKSGAFESEFDATGFTHGCDPKTPPNFDVTKGDALAPKDKDKDKDNKKDEKKKDDDKKPNHWKKEEKKEERKAAPPGPNPLPPPKPAEKPPEKPAEGSGEVFNP